MSVRQSSNPLFVTTLLFSVLAACVDSGASDDSGDTGLDTGAEALEATDSTPAPEPGALVELIDPCEGLGTPVVHADSTTDIVVGCGNGIGLWHSRDAGETFERAHPSGDLYVFDLERTRDGDLLVCGHDYDADGVLLYRGQPGGEWEPLLSYGNNGSDPSAAYLSNCGTVAEASDDRLVVASLTAGDITWSEDSGASWSKEFRYWEDDNLEPDGYAFHYLFHLVGLDDRIYGAGSQITEPPVFFQPSAHADASWWNLDSIVIDDSVEGEVWGLATADNGATWLAGGRDQSASGRASGFLYRSTDGGETWQPTDLPEGTDIVRAVAFDKDGRNAVAVGHKYPVTQGGFALVTNDGGETWTPIEQDMPLLESVAIVDGRFWLSGDAYLSMGAF